VDEQPKNPNEKILLRKRFDQYNDEVFERHNFGNFDKNTKNTQRPKGPKPQDDTTDNKRHFNNKDPNKTFAKMKAQYNTHKSRYRKAVAEYNIIVEQYISLKKRLQKASKHVKDTKMWYLKSAKQLNQYRSRFSD
jgi:hypothetical protein